MLIASALGGKVGFYGFENLMALAPLNREGEEK